MEQRRNSFDVSNTVDTTDFTSVNREIARIYLELFPRSDTAAMDRCFLDVSRLYRGEDPAYHGCDTAYHDVQHILEVSLAMARLMDGYERTRRTAESIGPRRFLFGIILALLHDVGYLRSVNDRRHYNGAEYTKIHVSRGARFTHNYMVGIGMEDFAAIGREIIHFTGYERPAARIRVPNLMFRLLGQMLGTADIVAQMADRCYLEKCRDRLFPEFVAGGLAAAGQDDNRAGLLFRSAEDLIVRTPRFFETASHRLNEQLGEAHKYAAVHFDGQNPYLDEIDKNVRYASIVAEEQDLGLLRRTLS